LLKIKNSRGDKNNSSGQARPPLAILLLASKSLKIARDKKDIKILRESISF